eukprot:CAMPEP_0114246236 /NCGR_PEP_ID=MMETSP0058-20121206/12347_1 /TAXON_ID=36894 /ORGANISM="Pyramimonas parkeae, CCMP726" /LENGTH=392 /DNA_ID=CAMNT_0001359393 /DNA_START=957 /DNA_END=2135 /DNA_ORIENTATION=-
MGLLMLLSFLAIRTSRGHEWNHTQSLVASSSEDLPDSEAKGDEVAEVLGLDLERMPAQDLNKLFHWAVENSNPEELRRLAEGQKHASEDEKLEKLKRQRENVAEMMAAMNTGPTVHEMMEANIEVLNNATSDSEQRHSALMDLKELLAHAPVDFSNDLHGMGGMDAVVRQLSSDNATLKAAAFWCLGTVAANNPPAQAHQLSAGVLSMILDSLRADSGDTLSKAVYALSALMRNNLDARTAFYSKGGIQVLSAMLADAEYYDDRLRRKALQLVHDLATDESQIGSDASALQDGALCAGVLAQVPQTNMDTSEKALQAILALTDAQPRIASLFQEAGADVVLAEMKSRVAKTIRIETDADEKEYLEEVISLVHEVWRRLTLPVGGSGQDDREL